MTKKSLPWSPGVDVGFMAMVDVVTMMIVIRQMRERPAPTIIFFLSGESLANMKDSETFSQLESSLGNERPRKDGNEYDRLLLPLLIDCWIFYGKRLKSLLSVSLVFQ